MDLGPIFAIVGLGAVAGGFVSGLAGFGAGPVVLAIWFLIIEPQVAVPLLMVSSIIPIGYNMRIVWKQISFQRLWVFIGAGAAGIPVGAWLLTYLSPSTLKLVIGVGLVLYALVRLFWIRNLVVAPKTRLADGITGFAGGVASGIAGIPGPIITVWSGVRGWTKMEQRAVFQPFNFAMTVLTLPAFFASGLLTSDVLRLALVASPGLLIGVLLGTPLFLRLSDGQFQKIMLLLLMAMGFLLVAGNLR